MTPEDLFSAIGGVESSRLERTELGMSSWNKEETTMYAKKTRVLRSVLIAAIVTVMLATTVFAAGYILFENPKQMFDALFGKTYDNVEWSVPDYKGDVAAEFHSDRVPVDESVAETLEKSVETVGQSITWHGHTLTVDTNVYDAVTKCGFVTYTIENPKGIREYNVAPNGEVCFPYGELLKSNQYGRNYVIQEKCTPTTLCATYYYQTRNPQNTDLELTFCFWAAIEDPQAYMQQPAETQQDIQDCEEKIIIPGKTTTDIKTRVFGDGAVTLSPFSVTLDLTKLPEDGDGTLQLTFRDGTEYIVRDLTTVNYLFSVGASDYSENTLMMNRLIDVDSVTTVFADGVQFTK